MPFGYSDYLIEQGKSTETIDSYVKEINYFFAFLDFKYKTKKELYEITPKDINDYLEKKKADGSKQVTINKHITIIKNFFNFLWVVNKIPSDPSVKIKRLKEIEKSGQKLVYESLLKVMPEVLKSPNYSPFRKVVFILAMQGLRTSEFRILKENITERKNEVLIKTKKREIALKSEFIDYFMEYYNKEAIFNCSNYLFVTKKHNNDIVPVEGMTIYTHLRAISDDFNIPKLVLNDIRHAYAYYLYKDHKYSIEEIANKFGIEENSAALLVDASLSRIEGKVS
ncbi:tyrosine-type recombinase/integrase [Sutcliffiella cohnii]|uniref:tyrosine-type recombinase/integrase n=1 Tax=Sutcliffiella cohnii TaxID=33932 RepID=UPI000830D864|nr:site-specific integrase [Sutcliffiella cohnii]